MRATLCILLVMSVWMLLAQEKCPSGYVYLGTEGNYYVIPGEIEEGYISYGANGRFILLPFTTLYDFQVKCDVNMGEPWPWGSTQKKCCFKRSNDTGYGNYLTSTGQWGHVYKEGDQMPVGGWEYAALRYGSNGKWLYQVTSYIASTCNNPTFGTILDQISKECSVTGPPEKIKAEMSDDDWTLCGTASVITAKHCEGLVPGAVHWIRFGSHNKYHYTMVISGDGTFPCHWSSMTSASENDAHEGAMCWRSEPNYEFGISGQWVAVVGCSGCAPLEYEVSVGLSTGKEMEKTEQWYWSLSRSISGGIEYKGVGGSTSLTFEVGQTFTNRIMHSVREEKVKKVTVTCDTGTESLYQFVSTVKETVGSTSREYIYRFGGDIYRCQGSDPPRCPPEFCKDVNCQTCKEKCKYGKNGNGKTCNEVALSESGGHVIHEPSTWLQIPDVTISLLWICILAGTVIILLFSNVAVILRSCYNGKKKGYDVVVYDSEI